MDDATVKIIQNLAYLVAAVLFIRGLKGLTHPRTAVRGNLTSSLAMLIAVLATLWAGGIVEWKWIIAGLLVGSAVGTFMALRVPMTSMPELVAVFNGFGGGASALVAGAELVMVLAAVEAGNMAVGDVTMPFKIATAASGLIGAVTLTGSLVAFGKLAEFKITLGGKKYWMSSSILVPGRHFINSTLALTTLLLCVLLVRDPSASHWYWVLLGVAGVLGVLITIPIGGADMPVVIALLNSYSGLAACSTGFVINNNVLIIAGSLVGASGLILTKIMCKAMNRSLVNVIFATMGPTGSTPSADDIYEGKVKSTSSEEVAMLLEDARRVVIVPGYGMAASQAQHAVRNLANLLEARGCTVEYGIHPVAGRMPGHMNVLLAEADVPYDKLLEMDHINPVARTDPNSPIAGMPIIDVDKCRTVVVIKRSLSPGFAGIPNPLFVADNTLMYFSDGKKAFMDLATAVKDL